MKSMAGEALPEAELRLDGMAGDRMVQARNAQGRTVTARTRPELLRLKAVSGPDGEPLVDGRRWNSPGVAADVVQAAGPGTTLVRDLRPEARFDILPLLIATDGAVAAAGEDARRFRPNFLIGGVEGLDERSWEGRILRVGEVRIAVADLRGRCIMTTFHPDTLAQDTGVLRRIQREFDGVLGLNAAVLEPGFVRVGDSVEILGPVAPRP